MNAKEKLQDVIEDLSEAEAEAAIRYIADLRRREAAAQADVRDGSAGNGEVLLAGRRAPSRHGYGLRAVAAVPAAILIAVFIAAYTALIVIVAVVVVRG